MRVCAGWLVNWGGVFALRMCFVLLGGVHKLLWVGVGTSNPRSGRRMSQVRAFAHCDIVLWGVVELMGSWEDGRGRTSRLQPVLGQENEPCA